MLVQVLCNLTLAQPPPQHTACISHLWQPMRFSCGRILLGLSVEGGLQVGLQMHTAQYCATMRMQRCRRQSSDQTPAWCMRCSSRPGAACGQSATQGAYNPSQTCKCLCAFTWRVYAPEDRFSGLLCSRREQNTPRNCTRLSTPVAGEMVVYYGLLVISTTVPGRRVQLKTRPKTASVNLQQLERAAVWDSFPSTLVGDSSVPGHARGSSNGRKWCHTLVQVHMRSPRP